MARHRGSSGRLRRFQLAARLTNHIRHRQKYLDVPVPAHLAFYFPGIGMPAGRHARTLTEFMDLLVQAPREVLDGHLRRHDFSRWIADVYGDRTLAAEIHLLEDAYEQGGAMTSTMPWPRSFAIGMRGSRRRRRNKRAKCGNWKKSWELKLPAVLSALWVLR